MQLKLYVNVFVISRFLLLDRPVIPQVFEFNYVKEYLLVKKDVTTHRSHLGLSSRPNWPPVNMALQRRWSKACHCPSTPSSLGSVPRPSMPPLSSHSCRSTASTPAGASVTCDSPASRTLKEERWLFSSFFCWKGHQSLVFYRANVSCSRFWPSRRSAGRWSALRLMPFRAPSMRCWAPLFVSSPTSPRSESLSRDGSVTHTQQ